MSAFATSYIKTTSAQATRAADVAVVSSLAGWFNASEGTVCAEFALLAAQSGLFPRAISFNDGTANNSIRLGVSGATAYSGAVSDGGVAQAALTAGTPVANSVAKLAMRYKANDFQMAANGTLATADTSGTVPSVNALWLGRDPTGVYLNGWLRRVPYYPIAQASATLQALTS